MAAAILVATAGVVVMSFKPGAAQDGGYRPTLLGLVSGAMFALSAIGYRGAILSRSNCRTIVLAATFTLAVGLRAAGGAADALSGAARHARC